MTLEIRANWQDEISSGELANPYMSPEEVATLGELCIIHNDDHLTEPPMDDAGEGPFLPVYPLADWLTWNWWRLLWEPPKRFSSRAGLKKLDWTEAHYVPSLRGGWLWPDISISSDGFRVALEVYMQSKEGRTLVVPMETFETCIDDFVGQVLECLDKCALDSTDLHSTWRDLSEERRDTDLTLYRKFEAYMGCAPGEAQPEQIHTLIEEGDRFGLNAVSEVAVEDPSFLSRLYETAERSGFDYCPEDGVHWRKENATQEVDSPTSTWSQIPAWEEGTRGARALRDLTKLGGSPVSSPCLASLCGIDGRVISRYSSVGRMSFSLGARGRATSRLVLRPRHPHGRRFEVARLLGDRLLTDSEDFLSPVTRSYTYRQRMQRAFAAEFLCPIDSLVDFLGGDYSVENRQEASYYFKVSEYTVRTQLVNRGYLHRDEFQIDLCDIEADVREAA